MLLGEELGGGQHAGDDLGEGVHGLLVAVDGPQQPRQLEWWGWRVASWVVSSYMGSTWASRVDW